MGKRHDEWLRSLYVGGRGNATARRFSRLWNWVQGHGLMPRRWVSLEVAGRRSGRITRFPLGMADVGGQWYLVSMLGECQWVLNVRAAGGHAVLRRRRPRPVVLVEVPVEDRGRILKRYVEKVPGGRPHLAVDRRDPVEAFERIAPDHSIFLVRPAPAGG